MFSYVTDKFSSENSRAFSQVVFPENLSFQRNTVGILCFISVPICVYKSGITSELHDNYSLIIICIRYYLSDADPVSQQAAKSSSCRHEKKKHQSRLTFGVGHVFLRGIVECLNFDLSFWKIDKTNTSLERLTKLWSLKKINKCLFIPNCTGKIMWLSVIYGKIRDGLLSMSKARASSAKIIYSNRAFGQNNCVRSKQWYAMISSQLQGTKKFQVRLNNSRNCSVCVRITFDEM